MQYIRQHMPEHIPSTGSEPAAEHILHAPERQVQGGNGLHVPRFF